MSKRIIAVIGVLVMVSGCDYVPQKTVKVETVSGDTVTFLCPEIERDRSTFTYFIDHECRLVKEPNQ